MSKLGLCENSLRLPLTCLSEEKSLTLSNELESLNLIKTETGK